MADVCSEDVRRRSQSTDSTESLDPRVQVELEKLNRASQTINSLEMKLNEARSAFRQLLTQSTISLDDLHRKLGSCVDKARAYYAARIKAKEAQSLTQDAAQRFERACSQLVAAKEMVFLAEQGFFKHGQPFDPAWQEMLNHATMKVSEAEQERLESEVEHKQTALAFSNEERTVKSLQRELRRPIAKSRPYFELKAKVNQQMEDQKQMVGQLELSVQSAKRSYSEALNNLEQISESIHDRRRESSMRWQMGCRGSGVGAETPDPPPEHDTPSVVTTDTGQQREKFESAVAENRVGTESDGVGLRDEASGVMGSEDAGEAECQSTLSNAQVMADLQDAKCDGGRYLSPRLSREDSDDDASDESGSIAMLDDEQIERLMLDNKSEDLTAILDGEKSSDCHKGMSLPTNVSLLKGYLKDNSTEKVTKIESELAEDGKESRDHSEKDKIDDGENSQVEIMIVSAPYDENDAPSAPTVDEEEDKMKVVGVVTYV